MTDLLDEMRQCKSVQACIDLALTDAYGDDEQAVAWLTCIEEMFGRVKQVKLLGERGAIPSVNREQSLQVRVNNVVAIGAVLLVGGAFLFWYYGTMLAKNREAEEAAKQAAATKASGETKLPPLPRVEPPRLARIHPGLCVKP